MVFRALESRLGPQGTPDAIRTSLGWVLFDPALCCQCYAEVENDSVTGTCMHVILPRNAKVDPNFPPHEYEASCGLDHNNSRQHCFAHKIMKSSIKIVNGHFQLPLLWRHKNVFLPDNKAKNPADEATRCQQAQVFVGSSMWLSGPEFLRQAKEEGPEQLESLEQLPEKFPLFVREGDAAC